MFRGSGKVCHLFPGCAGDRRMVPRGMPRTLETLQQQLSKTLVRLIFILTLLTVTIETTSAQYII